MSDEAAPPVEDDNALTVRGSDGDPVPTGTRMLERESYERIVEGLRMASDAAAHLARREPEAGDRWSGLARRLDLVRRIAVQSAGIEDVARQKQTQAVRGDPLAWKHARTRFRDGLRQAAGGMRQMATCFRADLSWCRMAHEIETMIGKLNRPARRSPLIMPPGYLH